MELKVTNVQNFAVHDGPGIRTVIFLAGCPLRCAWCHNPETYTASKTLVFEEKKCIGCRICESCESGVHSFAATHEIRRELCKNCGFCIDNCPTGALSFSVRSLGSEELMRIIEKQKRLHGHEGGITFSGGEPLMQTEGILSMLKGIDVHVAVETSGYSDEITFARLIERMDYVMMDLKIADETLHKKYTGVSNRPILKNLEQLRRSRKSFILRTPLIPGVTDTEDNLSALSEIIGNDPWQTLPYNPLAPVKYKKIGLNMPLEIKP